MIKAKFGDHLRSRTNTAMVNESLCKILCHNVCCLIQSHYELAVEATFWADGKCEQEAARQTMAMDDIEAMMWV